MDVQGREFRLAVEHQFDGFVEPKSDPRLLVHRAEDIVDPAIVVQSGLGRLGSIVAQYAHAFRLRVIACDLQPINQPNIEQVSFDQLLAQSDILTIHIHLNQANTNLIDRDAFAKMKPQTILVNTSRGAIIDETALIEALETGQIAAAGLDVINGEWLPDLTQHPLIKYLQNHDNLIITPHLGGITVESQQMAYQAAAQKIVQYFADNP